MQILCVDVGTGTQDIFLFDTRLDIENGFKMVVPSPTMILHRRVADATRRQVPILLTGVTMGGGPSHWAVEHHLEAGLPVYATPNAARSFNDDLEFIEAAGIRVVSEDEAQRLPGVLDRFELKDFDFDGIRAALAQFGVSLGDLGLVAAAVFDHGAAPPNYSDRKFRFEYLEERIRSENRLSAFAFESEDIPPIMTRMQAVAASAGDVPAPLMLMDTAPAAVLGATLDPRVRDRDEVMVANIGNFHTLAFRLGGDGIDGVFEHHTGFMDTHKMDGLLNRLADGTLEDDEVFYDHGHGARVFADRPLRLPSQDYGVVVIGPRRKIMLESSLRPYFAAPFGDMMLVGCFGMLAAAADVYPALTGEILDSLARGDRQTAPWDVD